MTPSPEVTAGAKAMRAVHDRYKLADWNEHGCFVRPVPDNQIAACFTGTRAECQAWIDCQAFHAGLAALLPVNNDVTRAMESKRFDQLYSIDDSLAMCNSMFTAAINHITSGSAKA